jgi:putative membrane protein
MGIKIKQVFIEIAKGFIVGMGMIAPGLSGGVFAVSLGIYPRIMKGISHILKHPIRVIKDLFWIGVGGVIGFSFTFILLLQLIAIVPLPFSLFFIGFIVGAIPGINAKIKNDVSKPWVYIFILTAFTLIVFMPLLPEVETDVSQLSFVSILILFIVGFILAGTLIIPGISGSLVLMALGFYTFLITSARDFIDVVFDFQIEAILTQAAPLIIVGVGFLIGLIIFAKSITYLLQKHQTLLYAFVTGLLLASPISIIWESVNAYENFFDGIVWNIPLGIVFLIFGFLLAKKMATLEDHQS